jgi:hypothetical protein
MGYVGVNISQLTPLMYLRLIGEKWDLFWFWLWLIQEMIKSLGSEGQVKSDERRQRKLRTFVCGSEVHARRCGEEVAAKVLQGEAKSTREEEGPEGEARDLQRNDLREARRFELEMECKVCRGEAKGSL